MLVTQDNFSWACSQIKKSRGFSLDTETTGLDETDLPFAWILATDEEVFYFDERATPNFWEAPEFVDLFNTDEFIDLQNAKFDMRMVGMKGVKVTRPNDIAIWARVLNNSHTMYNLASQAKRHGFEKLDDFIKKYIKDNNLYEERKDFFGEVSKQPRYDWVPIEEMQKYAEIDARITRDLANIYRSQADEDDLRVIANELDLTPVLFRMERLGVSINKDYTLQGYYYELDKVEKFKAEFKLNTGEDYTNSAKSLQKVLSVQLPTTDKGNPTLTDEVIESMYTQELSDKDTKTLQLVQYMRYHEKRISTYYKPFLNKMDANGKVHCSMWQAGTRTGRFSSSDTNMQNVPKEEDSKDPFVIRGCIVPSPGNTFISIDYSQMEYRMMAAYANETNIINRVMAGEDFHQVTADMFGVSRKTAKTLNFAILYGAGDAKLSGMLKVTIHEAKLLKLKYFMALPNVERLVDNIIRTGKSRGYVKTWLGRKLRADFQHCYALPNHLIQGGCADVVKMAMVRIDREFPHLKMVLQVHDQLVFDMDPKDFKHIPRIKEIMETVWTKNGMVLGVDISYSNVSLAERDLKKGIPSEI